MDKENGNGDNASHTKGPVGIEQRLVKSLGKESCVLKEMYFYTRSEEIGLFLKDGRVKGESEVQKDESKW